MSGRTLSLLVGLAASISYFKWGSVEAVVDTASAGVFAGVLATLLGFMVSAGALLYAVANTRLARNLQRTGHFRDLLKDLFFCAAVLLASLVAACFGLVSPPGIMVETIGITVAQGVSIMLVGLTATSLASLVPVGKKMWLLLSNLQPEDTGSIE